MPAPVLCLSYKVSFAWGFFSWQKLTFSKQGGVL